MDMSTTVVVAADQLSANLGGGSVVLDVASGISYGMDEVAARIWELLQAPVLVSVIRDAILAEYEVDAATCEADVLAFLTSLKEQGMIEVVDGHTG